MELKGKNALITGGAVRLGRAFAIALADKGVNVAIHYNESKREAEELVNDITARDLKSVAIQANIEDPNKITKVVKEAREYLGGLNILINNASIFYSTPVNDVTEKDWEQFLNINLKSQFYFAKEFASVTGKGIAKIINMADTYGASPAADFIPYGVSKAGVISLTKGLAKEYAPDILVNCICPGPILMAGEDKYSQQKAAQSNLLKREGNIEDVTKTLIFLAENDYITGQALFIDGGRHV